ncbi:MAG: hypothetical protein NTW16_15430 [Bacteroidetes bacterium]|nr:hypothetical protein [Bacteroidota bacterium]
MTKIALDPSMDGAMAMAMDGYPPGATSGMVLDPVNGCPERTDEKFRTRKRRNTFFIWEMDSFL